MAAAFRLFYFCIVFIVYCFSLASAQDDNQFIFNGFARVDQLNLSGAFVTHDGLLQLTDTFQLDKGQAFYSSPIKFSKSSSQSFSFSTNFVFAIVSEVPNFGGHGMAFVIAPSMDFSGAESGSYLGLFNTSSNGRSENHILAVELDTVQNPGFEDIDSNHVGIDVNSLISNDSAPVTYFSDKEGKNMNFNLDSGSATQMWIDYNGAQKLLNVTIAPIGIPRPSRPLLSTSIDLSLIFLDTMYVGFSSAAGGTLISEHYILGWSFNITRQAQDLDIPKLPPAPRRRKLTTVSRASDGWSFNTRRQAQNLDKSELPPPPPPRKASGKQEIWPQIAVAVLTAAIMIGTNLAILLFFFMRWRRARFEEKFLLELMNEAKELEIEGRKGFKLKVYSFSSITDATNCFSDENKLGEGGYGPVYKGLLDGQEIAIKRLSRSSGQGLAEFKNELIIVAKLQHTNLVQLLGFCIQGEEKMIVYEFMPHNSLDSYIFDQSKRTLFDWNKYFNIIEEIAQGILYLHKYSRLRIIHRDLKAGNILLDNNMNPKISDFGMARIFTTAQTEANTNIIVGTCGYMAPEYVEMGIFSTKSDVFSYGVLVLEIVSGRRSNINFNFDRPLKLIGYAWMLWKEDAALELMHPALRDSCSEDRVLRCINVALLCVEEDPLDRPSMADVISMLTSEGVKLPMPKQPAICIERRVAEVNSSTSGMIENCTINNLTMSVMIGR